ncbi:hypothetical protein DM860_017470 [Cuscuta australis]|uniref:RanBP2-type domain-containing protein n=1 Tax=Cuscuta australis TaxID=267555 RepID=A0A328E037_9ASTE|nr:hypothetical protein DM860_017470 [Cuscuta australis]
MKTVAMGVSLRRQVIWGFTYVKARWSSTQEIAENHRDSPTNVQLKPGKWLCTKCNFLNFAKNSRCLQCKENPPKRLLHPGEWECKSCNYINFKRNMVCLKCDHRRHRASHSVSYHHSRAPYLGTEKLFRDGAGMSSFSSEREMRRTDFPILGGKIAISQNVRKTREMHNCSRGGRNVKYPNRHLEP